MYFETGGRRRGCNVMSRCVCIAQTNDAKTDAYETDTVNMKPNCLQLHEEQTGLEMSC